MKITHCNLDQFLIIDGKNSMIKMTEITENLRCFEQCNPNMEYDGKDDGMADWKSQWDAESITSISKRLN